MPLLTVDLPNKKDDQIAVHSVIDDLNRMAGNTATQPAAHAAAKNITTQPDNGTPVIQPIRIAEVIKPNDQVSIVRDGDDRITLVITSPSGDGGAIIERSGDTWPAMLQAGLLAAPNQPLKGQINFTAFELPGGDRRISLKTALAKSPSTFETNIPAFVRSPRILIQWTAVPQ
jgi:hypothetical protein